MTYKKFTDQQLLFMFQEKSRQAEQETDLMWRKDQLQTDADNVFEELRTRGFFFNETNLGLLNAIQKGNGF